MVDGSEAKSEFALLLPRVQNPKSTAGSIVEV